MALEWEQPPFSTGAGFLTKNRIGYVMGIIWEYDGNTNDT